MILVSPGDGSAGVWYPSDGAQFERTAPTLAALWDDLQAEYHHLSDRTGM